MASAKSLEAWFNSPAAGSTQDEAQYEPRNGHGVPHTGQAEPPEYAANNPLPRLSGPFPSILLSSVEFTSYCLPAGKLSDDRTTRTTTDPGLASNAVALHALLTEQAALPPKPVVRIKGTHIDYVYSWGSTEIDFDLTLEVMPLIMPTATTCLRYVKIKPSPGDSSLADPLMSWVQRFCDDRAECKSLTLERLVINWDTAFLERKIRAAILSTKYKGNSEITFPITNSKVVIAKQSPDGSSSTPEHSGTSGKQKWLGPSRPPLKATNHTVPSSSDDAVHTYCPIQVIWPYASSPPDTASISQPTSLPSTTTEPRYAVQSEQEWWDVWKAPIRNGILAKKQGWVTVEDWQDVILGQVEWPEPKKSWGTCADDWYLLLKGLKFSGSHRGESGAFVKGMRYQIGA